MPGEIPPEVGQRFAGQRRKDEEFARQFGHVRPPIALETNGFKFVISGGSLVYQKAEKTKYFSDILDGFVLTTFARDWFETEITKPSADQHPLMEMRTKAGAYMRKQQEVAPGTFATKMTGPMAGYFCFAYDLWVVADTRRLDNRFRERLKNRDQFQGARHELFAEATSIRAGFEIEHEDESDGSMRHAEFTAIHRLTKQKLSVEAKSKHRPGLLGQPGVRENEGEYQLRVGRLLNDAVAKNPSHPLVVFLEMNLPWRTAASLLSMETRHPFIDSTLKRLRDKNGGKDPIPLLVITNHPEHYSEHEETAAPSGLLSIFTNAPGVSDSLRQSLQAIHNAANLYGNIPRDFDEQR